MQSKSASEENFPCNFPIKVMGKTGVDFETKVLSIIRKHCPELGETAISTRRSKEGTYMAITVMIYAKSKEQVDDIYQELSAEETVLMVL